MKQTVIMQYQGNEVTTSTLVEAAKEDFLSNAESGASISDLKLYVKPEERTAYYVVNKEFEGRVPF